MTQNILRICQPKETGKGMATIVYIILDEECQGIKIKPKIYGGDIRKKRTIFRENT